MRDEFYFPSKDGNTEIHTMEWKPDGEVKAVLQMPRNGGVHQAI